MKQGGPVIEYLLPRHVHACLCGTHVVLLDLKRNKYLAVDASKTRGLVHVVPGWPAMEFPEEQNGNAEATADELTGTIRTLVRHGLLSQNIGEGRAPSPPRMEPPTLSLTSDELDEFVRVPCLALLRFLTSWVTAAVALRLLSIDRIVTSIERRKKRRASTISEFDPDAALRLVACFERLKPLVFTSKSACLLESLALLLFLSRYGVLPTWVFGVRTSPFSAHCWLQVGRYVLNDAADRVRGYTPILAI